MSSGNPFPDITPSSRTFTPGQRPETRFESQNGATTFVQFGDQLVNAQLKMTFANLTDNYVVEILDHYEGISENDWVQFGVNNGLGGMSSDLIARVPKGFTNGVLLWRYSKPPQITSIYPGVSTVSCEFVGYFYGA